MIDDSERREVARQLAREAQTWRETFPDSECDFSDAAAIMQDLCVFIGLERNAMCSKVFKRLADLINRTTCENINEHYDVFECSECHCKVEVMGECRSEYGGIFHAPFLPSYCPNCGAEVK